jgi:PAS domain S-box-containing protein
MNRFKNNSQFWIQTGRLMLVAIAYWVAVRLGLLLVAQPEGVASIWPASGLALAVLLLSPKSQWTKLLAVIFVTNAAGNLSGGNNLPVSLGFALANTLEAFLGAWLLIYFCKSKITFERTFEIFILFGVAILSNGLTALLGAAVAGLAFGAPFFNTWLVWWTSDGLGMVLVAPFIVTLVTGQPILQSASPRRLVEAVALVFALTAFAWLLFGPFTVAEEPVLRNYMLFPLLIWLAFRYSPRGMSSALMLLAVIAVWNTLRGYGIFAFADQNVTEHLVALQMLLTVVAFSGLFLSAMLTELKQAGQSLRESEDKFKYVFENSTVGKSLTLTSGEMTVNKALCDMFGYTETEFKDKKWQEITHPQDIELTQREIEKLLSGEQNSARFVKRYIHKNGSVVWVDLSSALRRDADGKPLYLMTSVIDITERKRAEEILKQEQALSNAIIEAIPGTFYMLDEKGQYVRWNAYQRDEIVGKPDDLVGSTNALDTIHPDDRELIQSKIVNVLANDVDETIEGRVLLRGGPAFRWLLMTGRRMLIDNRPFLVGIGIDITERKQAEEKLKESLALLRIAEQAAKLGGWSVDLENNRCTWSDQVAAIHEMPAGYSPLVEEGINFYAPEWREKIAKVFGDCAQKGIPYNEEMEIITANGKRVWVQTMGEAVRDDQGKIYKVQGAFQDISERKQVEDALKESEKRFATIFRANPAAIAMTRLDDGQLVDVNASWQRITGYVHTEVVGHTPLELNLWVKCWVNKARRMARCRFARSRGKSVIC